MKLNASVEAALVDEFDVVAKRLGLPRARAIEAALRLYIDVNRRTRRRTP